MKLSKHTLYEWAGKIEGNDKYTKFIILTRSRTGSTLLIDCLDQERSVVAKGELLKYTNNKELFKKIKKIYCNYPDFIKCVGFKIFYYHPEHDHTKDVWRLLNGIEGLKIIHLKRKNVLRIILSSEIAHNMKAWIAAHSDSKDNINTKKVSLAPQYVLEKILQTKTWEEDIPKKLAGKEIINVYYEDIIRGNSKGMDKVCNFLGIKPLKLKTVLKKQNPEKTSNLISNYDELKEYFRNTEWETLFVED